MSTRAATGGSDSRTTLFHVLSATLAVSLCSSAAAAAAGQDLETTWGEPDLQGIWANQTLTPLERPETLAGREELSAEEIAQLEQTAAKTILIRRDRRDGRPETDLARAYNDFWNDRGIAIKATKQTSLVIDPPDGRIPPYTPQALTKYSEWAKSTGRVVDTTNFSPNRHFMGSFETLHLIEHFRRVDEDTLEYQFTIDDPATWTKPWTISVPIPKLEAEVPQIFEYSCHEGNYGMTSLLQGTRALERAKGLQ